MKVIFVDDDAKLLSSLRRMTLSNKSIQAKFALGGKEALSIMKEEDFDVAVVDMRMQGMDGPSLLKVIKKIYPDTVRIVLSGQSDKSMIERALSLAHVYLSKPCAYDKIIDTIYRLYSFRSILTNKNIRSLVGKIGMLPVLPKIYEDISAELENEKCSLSKVADIISCDIALTAGIMKIVNSSFFGFTKTIKTPKQAVTLLGTELIRGLVLSKKIFKSFDKSKHFDMSFRMLWNHSINTASLCKIICSKYDGTIDSRRCFNAGILHDVGKLILASKLPDEYDEILHIVRNSDKTIMEAEKELLSCTHAELGAYLLGLWGFSEELVVAVAQHHGSGSLSATHSPMSFVLYVANVFEHELVVFNDKYTRPQLDDSLLQKNGITKEQLDDWRKACEFQINNSENLQRTT